MKCDGCLNSRRIISENGLHSLCCLSDKKAMECITGKVNHSVILDKNKKDCNKFGFGDIVKIRDEKILAKVVMPIDDEESDEWWYEVEAVGIGDVPHREVKESDLSAPTNNE